MSSFANLLNSDFFKQCTASVVSCVYTACQPLFFSQLLLSRTRKIRHVERIDMAATDLDAFMLTVQTTFLGQLFCYWIVGLEEISDKKRTALVHFLQTYSGPHILIVWSNTPIAKQIAIEIPEAVQREHVLPLLHLITVQSEAPAVLVTEAQRLLANYKKLTIEQALQLLVYIVVAAGDREQIMREWGGLIVQVDQSLFTLSQHLFAKNQKKFRQLYDTMLTTYQDTFWVSFWSDQIWRAIHVIDAYQAKDFATAKLHGARLPFSFMNTDWRKYNKPDLIKAHNLLYTIDYQFKNGIQPQFDLFYLNFFK